MTTPDEQRAIQFNAQIYDVAVPDWPGEIDFYRQLADQAQSAGQAVLEVACGTGRIAIRLAQHGTDVLGMDLSPAMLAVAREKSTGIPNMRWVQADMRSFDLGQTFGLAIIPGHAFQHMLTPADQVACLQSIRRHLERGGRLVVHLDHQDIEWLGDLLGDKAGVFEEGRGFTNPATGNQVRAYRAWCYVRSTQTATVRLRWEEIAPSGEVVDRWQYPPLPLHCVFPFEMQHLLALGGYQVEALYGDFNCGEFGEVSPEMIWVARIGIE